MQAIFRKPHFRMGSLVCLIAASQLPHTASAEEKPLWEFGMGAGALQLPAYRGSKESRSEILPIPYLVYRGERFKADRDGVRGIFFESDVAEVNLSIAASPPVNSADVVARQGMPDLKPSMEMGPSVDFKLWHSSSNDIKLKLFLPLRAAFTVESDPHFIGWQLTPRLALDVEKPFGMQGWTLGTLAGPVFGSAAQHDYFYGVAPQYSTATRPAFEARSGYAGMQMLSALWKRFPTYWVGGFLRYDNVNGAVFENSPLVTQKSGFSGGIAISWILAESKQKVQDD